MTHEEEIQEIKNLIMTICLDDKSKADEISKLLLAAYFQGWQEGMSDASKAQEHAHMLFFGEGGHA